jgi:uncharacterized protein (DUF58 family)
MPSEDGRGDILTQAEALGLSLPPLIMRAERLASSVSMGLHGRRKAGLGQDFWQFHRYRAEDPASSIDWRQSARSQHLYVREREWEAAHSLWLWRDGSNSMRYGSSRETKLMRANLLAVALGVMLVRGGERIALYGGTEAPAASRLAARRIAHALNAQAPSAEALPRDAPLPRHAGFVWFGDFLAPLAEIEASLRRLIQKGAHGRLVHIVDPAEEDFPFTGRTRFESADGGEARIFGRAESIAPAYRRRFAARCETLSDLARSLGWNYLKHRTDHSPKTALIALYADLYGGTAAEGGP